LSDLPFLLAKEGIKFVRKLLKKNIDEFNIFLSASIVEIKNNRLKSERF
jgi:hypothetical protein|tara:strand:- start:1203 stop:1349 length:147 start_codon:yes stop_codon:yes gene_type:complete